MSEETQCCEWKLIPLKEYRFGIPSADRCGDPAAVRIIRRDRNKDLFLCDFHDEVYIAIYGEALEFEVLEPNVGGGIQ